ncbi:hypothetical protein PAPYR_6376 [Paratrimastix pyriformis]|uniref:Uncharacterized protein n=1 Tax=Paratrimastix pyriformis TaxID=342808 RepID=A0ABQ8UJ70_9EUKA|nr:hypothetical protein PAPYR_6376 [Paratrimastix pyriformis]
MRKPFSLRTPDVTGTPAPNSAKVPLTSSGFGKSGTLGFRSVQEPSQTSPTSISSMQYQPAPPVAAPPPDDRDMTVEEIKNLAAEKERLQRELAALRQDYQSVSDYHKHPEVAANVLMSRLHSPEQPLGYFPPAPAPPAEPTSPQREQPPPPEFPAFEEQPPPEQPVDTGMMMMAYTSPEQPAMTPGGGSTPSSSRSPVISSPALTRSLQRAMTYAPQNQEIAALLQQRQQLTMEMQETWMDRTASHILLSFASRGGVMSCHMPSRSAGAAVPARQSLSQRETVHNQRLEERLRVGHEFKAHLERRLEAASDPSGDPVLTNPELLTRLATASAAASPLYKGSAPVQATTLLLHRPPPLPSPPADEAGAAASPGAAAMPPADPADYWEAERSPPPASLPPVGPPASDAMLMPPPRSAGRVVVPLAALEAEAQADGMVEEEEENPMMNMAALPPEDDNTDAFDADRVWTPASVESEAAQEEPGEMVPVDVALEGIPSSLRDVATAEGLTQRPLSPTTAIQFRLQHDQTGSAELIAAIQREKQRLQRDLENFTVTARAREERELSRFRQQVQRHQQKTYRAAHLQATESDAARWRETIATQLERLGNTGQGTMARVAPTPGDMSQFEPTGVRRSSPERGAAAAATSPGGSSPSVTGSEDDFERRWRQLEAESAASVQMASPFVPMSATPSRRSATTTTTTRATAGRAFSAGPPPSGTAPSSLGRPYLTTPTPPGSTPASSGHFF